MLWIQPDKKRALIIPLLPILAALGLAVGCTFFPGAKLAFCASFFAIISLTGVSALSRRGKSIVLWCPGKSRAFEAARCAFGYHFKGRKRSANDSAIEVYLADGEERHYLLALTPPGTDRAKQLVQGLETVLLGVEEPIFGSGPAIADPAQIEGRRCVICRYYATNAWRYSPIILFASLLPVVGMVLYSVLSR